MGGGKKGRTRRRRGTFFFYPLFFFSNPIPERRKELGLRRAKLGLRPRFARNNLNLLAPSWFCQKTSEFVCSWISKKCSNIRCLFIRNFKTSYCESEHNLEATGNQPLLLDQKTQLYAAPEPKKWEMESQMFPLRLF